MAWHYRLVTTDILSRAAAAAASLLAQQLDIRIYGPITAKPVQRKKGRVKVQFI